MPQHPLHHLSAANMILSNPSHQLRIFPIPTSSSSTSNHLPISFGSISSAAAGSGGIAGAAAIAMQAAAQAANYQHSLHSAANLVNDMKAGKLQPLPINKPYPSTLLSSMIQRQSALGRHPFLPGFQAALSSHELSSLASPPSPLQPLSPPSSLKTNDKVLDGKT